jgi:DNA-binding NarL/FixJ family response regulator
MEAVVPSQQSGLTARIASLASTNTSEIDLHKHHNAADLPYGTVFDVAIVDNRSLIRECLGRSLLALEPRLKLKYLSTVEEFDEVCVEPADVPRVLLISMTSLHGIEVIVSQISRIKSLAPDTRMIVLSETESIRDILPLFESGASGYMPPSIDLEVAVRALQLVAAGGFYLPASILSGCGDPTKQQADAMKVQDPFGNGFTSKQIAVSEALRRGKANKIIAYELNMCESTVKAHVQNVMKKLRAKSRAEAAYILNEKLTDGVGARADQHGRGIS